MHRCKELEGGNIFRRSTDPEFKRRTGFITKEFAVPDAAVAVFADTP